MSNPIDIPPDRVVRIRQDGMSTIRPILGILGATSGTVPLTTGLSGESDGTVRTMLVGINGTDIVRVELEPTGEQKVVMYGKDSGANLDPIRTNASQQLQIEIVPLEVPVQVDSILIPSTEGVLLDGSASLTAAGIYEITFNVVNIDGSAAVTVSVGVDLAAAGSLAAAEYFLKDVVVPAGGQTGDHKITMAADDDIRGIASAASDAAMWFTEVKRVG